jgi:ribosomal protein S18 acetylase RimI-like enzyme
VNSRSVREGMKIAFFLAKVEHIDAVVDIITQCQDELTTRGILQWDALYPNRTFFEQAVSEGSLFVMVEGEVVVAVAVLDERQATEWDAVVWQNVAGRNLVVHSFAVLPSSQGKGYGTTMLGFCETFAREAGYTDLRLDAFSENEAALRFYARHGYLFQGAIELTFKPEGHRTYFCYQKLLAGVGVQAAW